MNETEIQKLQDEIRRFLLCTPNGDESRVREGIIRKLIGQEKDREHLGKERGSEETITISY
jgi:hypothetical protein